MRDFLTQNNLGKPQPFRLKTRMTGEMGLFNIYITYTGGWVSTFLVMLRDGKQGVEWYLIKGCNVMVKKIIKPLFLLL